MRFQADAPFDPNDSQSIPPVTEITPELIRQMADYRKQQVAGAVADYQALVAPSPPYRVGPTDVLSIIVWDHPELTMPNLTYTIGPTNGVLPTSAGLGSQSLPGYVVSQDGYVQFPYINTVHVAGLTEIETKNIITRKLQPFIRDPQVTVRVVGYRSQRVFLDGELRAPQVGPISDVSVSLASALNTAGGITPTGDASRISLVRQGRTYLIDLPELIRLGLSPARIALYDNDVITVPPLIDKRIFVAGEVSRQGPIPFRHSGLLTLSAALGDAGGMLQTSSDPRAIYVIRPTKAGDMPFIFHLSSKSPTQLALARNFPLQPNDIVYVDAPGIVRLSRVISLLTGSATSANSIGSTIRYIDNP
jgi:polysaccharide export outer membrane protein